jgi:hypothetical protein
MKTSFDDAWEQPPAKGGGARSQARTVRGGRSGSAGSTLGTWPALVLAPPHFISIPFRAGAAVGTGTGLAAMVSVLQGRVMLLGGRLRMAGAMAAVRRHGLGHRRGRMRIRRLVHRHRHRRPARQHAGRGEALEGQRQQQQPDEQ